MNIHGLQKMTLLDFPGLVACTVFLGGCNMRCPFCHNWELVDGSAPVVMDDRELIKFLGKRQGLLDGVAFTGGEPLLRPELPELIREIRQMGFKIKLDTNGSLPGRLDALIEEGLLDYVAMDIKNSRERYGETIGIPGYDISDIEKSVQLLLSGKVPYEFRTTVLKKYHDSKSFEDIALWISGASQYYLQAFVDRDTVPTKNLEAYTPQEMQEFLDIVRLQVPDAQLRGIE